MAKTGYSKSGKSLKALRRYYALQNQAKKSKEDDKLSKRIAAELQTQQTANEKRGALDTAPTERSALPVVMSPKETAGPVFTLPLAAAKTNKSAKSLKSGVIVQPADGTPVPEPRVLGTLETHCVVLCEFAAVCLVLAMILEVSLRTGTDGREGRIAQMLHRKHVLSVSSGIAGALIALSVPYWIFMNNTIINNVAALISLFAAEVVFSYGYGAYFVQGEPPFFLRAYHGELNDQALLLLALSTSVLGLIVLTLVIRQIIFLRKTKAGERLGENIGNNANISNALGAV